MNISQYFSDNVPYVDIDECLQNSNLCQQLCVNTDGSYTCACMDGYQLIKGTNQCEGTVKFSPWHNRIQNTLYNNI